MQLPPGDECSEVLRLYTALLHNVSVERPASAEPAEPLVLDPKRAPSQADPHALVSDLCAPIQKL